MKEFTYLLSYRLKNDGLEMNPQLQMTGLPGTLCKRF